MSQVLTHMQPAEADCMDESDIERDEYMSEARIASPRFGVGRTASEQG